MSDERPWKELGKRLDNGLVALITGLTTNGARHKQFYLEEALRLIAGDKFTDDAKQEFRWEEGQPWRVRRILGSGG